ncbi:unnamed protein product [Paramecium sonneborni]|uniref:Uncharacterized protein n=1 Tax=Paramecium sonneborni TaxID=65129 RepID=A0A8S1N6J1_9CILI|nr:unnamed protein product [Paramecium sonneborni]
MLLYYTVSNIYLTQLLIKSQHLYMLYYGMKKIFFHCGCFLRFYQQTQSPKSRDMQEQQNRQSNKMNQLIVEAQNKNGIDILYLLFRYPQKS